MTEKPELMTITHEYIIAETAVVGCSIVDMLSKSDVDKLSVKANYRTGLIIQY